MRFLTALALRHAVAVVVVFALATAFFVTRATQTATDGSTDALYPPESAAAILADELAVDFAQGDRLLLVVEGDVWSAEGLTALRSLTRAIDGLEGTRDVTSLATAKRLEDDDGFLIVGDLIPADLGDTAAIADARAYLEGAEMYGDVVFVDDAGRRASLIIEYDGAIDAAAYARTVADATAATWPGEHALAGAAFTTMELREIIARDLPVLGATALALILIMLWVNFRTGRRVALALVQIVIGVVWGMGIFQLLGQELMALTVIGPIAVMAVGASFSMHLLGRYDYELARGTEKLEALRRTFERTGLGVLVSGLAISAAMSTFLLSDLAMVRGLGLVAALGVLSSLVAALVLLPALLRLLPDPARVPDPEAPGRIRGLLAGLAGIVTRRPRAVMALAAVLVAGALLGIARIEADTSILAFFPADGATRQSVRTVEETLGGSSVVQVRVDGDILDPEVLRALESFQAQAKTLPEVGGAQSITQVMRAIHGTLTGEAGLPPTRQAAAQELLLYTSSGDAGELAKLLTLDEGSALVNLVVESGSTTRGREVLADLERMADATLGGLATYGFTGQAVLELAVEDAMRHDFLISLTLAILLVLAIDSLVRSFRAAAVTILALVATIALQYGLLGWAGIPLNLATMLMGALAIGVGDYAIHLTVRYMEERAPRPRPRGRRGPRRPHLRPPDPLHRHHPGRGLLRPHLRRLRPRRHPRLADGPDRRARRRRHPDPAPRRRPRRLPRPGRPRGRARRRPWRYPRMKSTASPTTARRPTAPFALAALLAAAFALLGAPAAAQAYATADELMAAVEARPEPASVEATLEMTITNAAGQSLTREMRSWSTGDERRLLKFTAPADIAGSGFLRIDDGTVDETLVYLPALDRVRRVAGGQRGESFFGSDFAYEDVEGIDPDDYTFELLRVDEGPRYVIEATPTEASGSTYDRLVLEVPEATLIPERVVYYRDDEAIKELTVHDVQPVGDYLLGLERRMETLDRGSVTVIRQRDVTLDGDLPDEVFTERFLRR